MKNIITLTAPAAAHIKKMLEEKAGSVGFRLSIKKTGCSGYSYVPTIIDKVLEQDVHFVETGIHIFIDREWLDLIKDIVIDYVADGAGLKQKRLVFINPNEKARCGCGESFTIE